MSLRLFALSDPHLSFSRPKPMDVFGPRWDSHAARIAEQWRDTVRDGDIVLMPGDISWAMRFPDAIPDLEWLAALPGRKVLVRGNHDYWWSSLAKMAKLALPGLFFIHNNHVVIDGIAIGGSRLWDFPFVRWNLGMPPDAEKREPVHRADAPEDPDKIRAHELERLSASLSSLPAEAVFRVAMTHYPPIGEYGLPTPVSELIGSYNIDLCVFGHIHTPTEAHRPGEDIRIGATRYVLTSSDHVGHKPLLLGEW